MSAFDAKRHNERNLRPNERLKEIERNLNEVVRFRPTFADMFVLHILNLFFWIRERISRDA
jgi:hypothetical protein